MDREQVSWRDAGTDGEAATGAELGGQADVDGETWREEREEGAVYPAEEMSRAEIDALAEEIAVTAAHLDAATHRLLTQIRAFDRAGGWHAQGALSCAHWLAWRIGLGPGPAREKVRVAHRLGELPLIDEALRRGEISYSKVRAMTRIATRENEAELLEMARAMTAAQLEKLCRLRRQVQWLECRDPWEVEERRWVSCRDRDDGTVTVTMSLLPDEAATVMRAIEACAGTARLADGAVAMAEIALAAGGAGRTDAHAVPPAPTETDASAETGAPEVAPAAAPVTAGVSGRLGGAGAGRPPVEVVVHVSAETLEGRTERGDGLGVETCRRLLCDAGVVPVLEAGGRTIDVGRRTRVIPAALRRALRDRDGGCRFPGCRNMRWLDAHHVQHWVDGGPTALDNTVLLCRRHHRYLHEYGFSASASEGAIIFRNARGEVIPPTGPRPEVAEDALAWLGGALDRHGVRVSAETNEPAWDGFPIDWPACVDSLAG